MIYSRITKFKKTDAAGNSKFILPNIRIKFLKTKANNDYEINTWEPCQENETEDQENYEYTESENEEDKSKFKRPQLDHGYLEEDFILLYNEEVFYENKEEILDKLPLEIIEPVFLDDEEIIIFGYPAQYILMHFKNRIGVMVNMIDSGDFEKEFSFKMTDYKPYEK